MSSDKQNNEDKQSVPTWLLQANDEIALTNGQNDAVYGTEIFHNVRNAGGDPVSFPYMPFAVSPWEHIHGTYQAYTNNILGTSGNSVVDLNQLPNLQNHLFDPKSIIVSGNKPSLYGQDLQCLEGNGKGLSCSYDKIRTFDIVINDSASFNSFQHPDINRNFTLTKCNMGEGHKTTSLCEADISNIHGPRIKNIVHLGRNSNMLLDTQNSGETGIGNNDKVCAAQIGCPKVFGSFLSLGTAGNTNVNFKSDLCSRDIADELDHSTQFNTSHIQQATGSSFNLGHNMAGGFSSCQDIDRFTSLGHQIGGCTKADRNIGSICGTNTSINSSQLHMLQKQDMQHDFPTSSTRNLGVVDNRDASYGFGNLHPYKDSTGALAASSIPFSSSSDRLFHPGKTGVAELVAEPVKFSWITSQPTYNQLEKSFTENVQHFSPDSSMLSSFSRLNGSSTRKEYSGQRFSANHGIAHCGAGSGVFTRRIGVQVSKDSAAESAEGGPFSQKPTIHVNKHSADQAAENGVLTKRTGIQVSDNHVAYAAECGLYPDEIRIQTAKKAPKRIAIQPTPTAPRVQRRKIALQAPTFPSVPSPPQSAPAASSPSPATAPHIKWQGCDGVPKPTGEKCMICKRDLSFTPEGRLYQPNIPPAVAVLPCRHTFHDHCLLNITPGDQSENPPCIPCAIGEI